MKALVEAGAPLPAFDCHAPLLSLPFLFGTRERSIPAAPYLKAPSPLQDGAPGRLTDRVRKRIGLVWAGRPGHGNDRNRSMTLGALRPLLENGDCDFFSLQLGAARGQIAEAGLAARLTDSADLLTDFAATASLIETLDLVIAVDTAVAHLAGALGKPAWLLLPFVPDWRWMLRRSDTPWYPTMRLFRQPAPGAWDKVVREAVEALAAFAKE